MTNEQLQLAAHQLGMVRAAKKTGAQGIADWRAHQQCAAELRQAIGSVYQPYPHPNRALVKALATSLREGLITRADFACCLANVRGEWI